MPLRVTKEYSNDENGQRVHRKMSKNGHYQKVRRPTGLEVYNDAAKILEELLEKRIDRDVKVARPRRNKTDPSTKDLAVATPHSDGNVTVARCKTMPSRYRESIDEDAKKLELEHAEKREQKKKLKKSMRVDTDSSANDTELESDADDRNVVTQNRKKKSLFKRAKENLIRTFQRDQKNGFGENDSVERSESNSIRKRKGKKKSSSIVSESKRSVKGHLNKDKSIDFVETVEYRSHSRGSHTDSHKHRTSSLSRSSLMDAIKKPFSFRKSLHKKNNNLDDDEKGRVLAQGGGGSKTLPIGEPGVSFHGSQHRDSPSPSSPPQPHPSIASDRNNVKESSNSPSPAKANPTHPDSLPLQYPGAGTLSSTTSTTYPNSSEYWNSAASLNVLPSPNCSVLDCPGDDIKFIDIVESDEDKRKSLIKYHGSEGLLNLQWLADQTANAKAFDFEINESSVSTVRPDGHLEKTTTVTATRTVVLPEVAEGDENDDHDGNGQSGESQLQPKEEIYGKIAQKLIEMADTYGGMSDSETMNIPVDTAALGDAPLTDLEKEIIACLRAGGDKYGKKIEDQLDALKSVVADDAYDRFRSTVENSMGHELSWNTLALLFYATKGVVSAVGKSSTAAVQAKEFTLKYISDTFVSWIMEQGGFDSMLSGSESDPDLD